MAPKVKNIVQNRYTSVLLLQQLLNLVDKHQRPLPCGTYEVSCPTLEIKLDAGHSVVRGEVHFSGPAAYCGEVEELLSHHNLSGSVVAPRSEEM